jgi:hypothetical protein
VVRPKKYPIEVSQKDDPVAYRRAYRALRPEVHERDKRQWGFYRKAEIIVRERHKEEFEQIYRSLIAAWEAECDEFGCHEPGDGP